MNVGLTYDLRDDYLAQGYSQEQTAEFDRAETIDAIEAELRFLGCSCDRIGNIRALTTRLARGERWDLVCNIAEGMNGIGREAQVPALLDAFGIPYTFSDPLTLALTMHKGLTKHAVRDMGIATPDFTVVGSDTDFDQVQSAFPLFVKPVAEGSSKGISSDSVVHTKGELIERCNQLLTSFGQPVLVETFLPGREFTVGIVGTGANAKALGAMEVLLDAGADAEVYSYANKVHYESRVRYQLIEGDLTIQAADVALQVWRRLGCRDAGRVDLRCDGQGVVNFLEVNPLAGLNPDHSDLPILCSLLDISYRQLIGMIFESATERLQ